MPVPVALAAALGGSLLTSSSTDAQNRRSQDYSREQYERERRDALRFWNLQNEYNSPKAQMARFQEAGLNPHLVYGAGNPGNAGAIQTPSAPRPEFRPSDFNNIGRDALGMMNAMADLDIKEAQVDNLQAQNTVIMEDALYKKVLRERGEFDLAFEKDLAPVSADARRERLRQTRTQIDMSIREDARRAMLTTKNLEEAAERMANMREQRLLTQAQTANTHAERRRIMADIDRLHESVRQMKLDGTLKQMDIELRKSGIYPHDSLWARMGGRALSMLFPDTDSPNIFSRILKNFK